MQLLCLVQLLLYTLKMLFINELCSLKFLKGGRVLVCNKIVSRGRKNKIDPLSADIPWGLFYVS